MKKTEMIMIFDENNVNWDRDQLFNMLFINYQLELAENILHEDGILFASEVAKMLGIEIRKNMLFFGWKDGFDYQTEIHNEDQKIVIVFQVEEVINYLPD